MSCINGYQDMISRIKRCDYFNNSQEYYYLLGQFVMYIFHILGGPNNFKREVNYLTNPIQPRSIYHLGKRNIKFITNYPMLVKVENSYATAIYSALLSEYSKYVHESVDEKSCCESFYEGLYTNNIIMKIAGIQV